MDEGAEIYRGRLNSCYWLVERLFCSVAGIVPSFFSQEENAI